MTYFSHNFHPKNFARHQNTSSLICRFKSLYKSHLIVQQKWINFSSDKYHVLFFENFTMCFWMTGKTDRFVHFCFWTDHLKMSFNLWIRLRQVMHFKCLFVLASILVLFGPQSCISNFISSLFRPLNLKCDQQWPQSNSQQNGWGLFAFF